MTTSSVARRGCALVTVTAMAAPSAAAAARSVVLAYERPWPKANCGVPV